MIIQPLNKIQQKLGRWYTPLLFLLFFALVFATLFTSVQQKQQNYTEGQVAAENIRANKTVENTAATEQKRQLAAESVPTEYNYQEDLATVQYDRVKRLFDLVNTVNDDLKKQYEADKKKAKKESVPEPTVDEHTAALKKKFENIDDEDVAF